VKKGFLPPSASVCAGTPHAAAVLGGEPSIVA
jgi:hypothetical protein